MHDCVQFSTVILSTHVHITDTIEEYLLLKKQSGYNYCILQVPGIVQNSPSANSFCLDLHVVGCQVEKLLPSDRCCGMLLAERLKLSVFFLCVCMCVCVFFFYYYFFLALSGKESSMFAILQYIVSFLCVNYWGCFPGKEGAQICNFLFNI